MSRREDRSSEPKRHRYRFDREPSPKRSRRDGKAESERPLTEPETDRDRSERDHKASRRLRDPLTLEAPVRHDSKFESGTRSKVSENQIDGHHGGAKQSSDPTRVPRSRSYYEHDNRGSLGKNGRSFNRRTDKERGWWRDPKEAMDKTTSGDARHKDDKAKDNNREDDRVWRHDGYFQMEANPKPPLRKRPAFREQKISTDEKIDKAAAEPGIGHPVESGKRDERVHTSRHSDKPERQFAGERDLNKSRDWRGNDNFSSRDRSDPSSRHRGSNDRFNARQGYHPPVGRVEKWKHDLYDEANKSVSPKKEEDQISKIEALLAS